MNYISKHYLIRSGIFALLLIIFTILVKVVNVAPIGPEGSKVGFSVINGAFHNIFPLNMLCYNFTKKLGLIVLLVPCFFVIVGLKQLIERKHFFKVDLDIYFLAILYILILLVYVFFEKVIINYRPVIIEGKDLEASYPSTHTFITICIMETAIMQVKSRVLKLPIRAFLITACYLIIIIMVIGRVISGVHWLTDYIAAVILSIAFINLYAGLCRLEFNN